MELCIRSETSTVQPLKFGNGYIITSHILLVTRLLTHAGMKLIHVSKGAPGAMLWLYGYYEINWSYVIWCPYLKKKLLKTTEQNKKANGWLLFNGMLFCINVVNPLSIHFLFSSGNVSTHDLIFWDAKETNTYWIQKYVTCIAVCYIMVI